MKKRLIQLMTLALNTSLAFGPNYVYAAPEQSQQFTGKDLVGITQQAGAMTNQILSTILSVQQQAQMQSTIANITSNEAQKYLLDPDRDFPAPAFRSKRAGDAFFAQCGLLPAKSNHIANACESLPSSPVEMATLSAYLIIATKNANTYENETKMGNGVNKTTGVQCLSDMKTKMSDALNERALEMDKLIDGIKKQNEALTASLAKTKNQIKDLNEDLNGDGLGEKSAKNLNSKVLDDQCRAFLTEQETKKAGFGGLLGIQSLIKEDMGPDGDKKVQSLINDSATYKAEILAYANKSAEIYSKTGRFDKDYLTPSSLGIESSDSFNAAIKSATKDYELSKAEYENNKKKFDLPGAEFPADILGDKNADDVLNNWKNKYYNSCLTNSMGITIDDFAKKIKDPNSQISNSSTNKGIFQTKVRTFLADPTLSLEKKIALIRAEEAQGYASNLRFQPGASVGNYNPTDQVKVSDYLDGTNGVKQKCDNDFTTERNEYGLTASQIMQQAKVYKAQMDGYKATMPTAIENAIINRMVDCDGIKYQTAAGSAGGSCDKSKIDPKSSMFCLSQSVSCASSMQACYNKVDNLVRETQSKQQQLADTYNQAIDNHVQNQRLFLEQLKAAYATKAQALNKAFPGGQYDLPSDLILSLEDPSFEEVDPKYGVKIKNGKSLVKNIEDKVATLKEAMKSQNDKLLAKVQERIDNVQQNAPSEMAHWKSMADKCKNKIDEYNKGQLMAKDAADKKYGEDMNNLNAYCLNHDHAYRLAGCEEEASSLYSDAIKVAGMLDPREMKQNSAYKRLCAQFNKNNPSDAKLDADSFCKQNSKDEACKMKADDSLIKKCSDSAEIKTCKDVNKFGCDAKPSFVSESIAKCEKDDDVAAIQKFWFQTVKKAIDDDIEKKIARANASGGNLDKAWDEAWTSELKSSIGENRAITSCGSQDDSAGGIFAASMKEITNSMEILNKQNASGR